jgi:uncharacterized RDD family membrane protein YckC
LIGILFYLPGAVVAGLSFAAGHDGICRDTYGSRTCRQPSGALLGLAVLMYLAGIVIYYVIYCRKLGRTGQTWGRKAMGYKVVDKQTGQPIGAGKAFGRQLVKVVDALPCYLGYLWPLWDKEHQTFSDKLMGTYAIKV